MTGRFHYGALSVQPKSELNSPPLNHSAGKPPGKLRVLRGMTPVAQSYQIGRFVCSTRGSRQKVMNVGVGVIAANSAFHTGVIVTSEHLFPDLGPIRGGLHMHCPTPPIRCFNLLSLPTAESRE